MTPFSSIFIALGLGKVFDYSQFILTHVTSVRHLSRFRLVCVCCFLLFFFLHFVYAVFTIKVLVRALYRLGLFTLRRPLHCNKNLTYSLHVRLCETGLNKVKSDSTISVLTYNECLMTMPQCKQKKQYKQTRHHLPSSICATLMF